MRMQRLLIDEMQRTLAAKHDAESSLLLSSRRAAAALLLRTREAASRALLACAMLTWAEEEWSARLLMANTAATQRFQGQSRRWRIEGEREFRERAAELAAEAAELKREWSELRQERCVVEGEAVAQRQWHAEYRERIEKLASRDADRVACACVQIRLSRALYSWRVAVALLLGARAVEAEEERVQAAEERVQAVERRMRAMESRPVVASAGAIMEKTRADEAEARVHAAQREKAAVEHQLAKHNANLQLWRDQKAMAARERQRSRVRRLAGCFRSVDGAQKLSALHHWSLQSRMHRCVVQQQALKASLRQACTQAREASEMLSSQQAFMLAQAGEREGEHAEMIEQAERRGYSRALQAALASAQRADSKQTSLFSASDGLSSSARGDELHTELARARANLRAEKLWAVLTRHVSALVSRAWAAWQVVSVSVRGEFLIQDLHWKTHASTPKSAAHTHARSTGHRASGEVDAMQRLLVDEVKRTVIAKDAAESAAGLISRQLDAVQALGGMAALWVRLSGSLRLWALVTAVLRAASEVSQLCQQLRSVGALAQTRGAMARAVADRETEVRQAVEAHEAALQKALREAASASRREAGERARREAAEVAHRKALRSAGSDARRVLDKLPAAVAFAFGCRLSA
ncbi:MAG: hypothetical protein SGPRY_014945, partial [Prymnesium sp.]